MGWDGTEWLTLAVLSTIASLLGHLSRLGRDVMCGVVWCAVIRRIAAMPATHGWKFLSGNEGRKEKRHLTVGTRPLPR